MTKKRLKSSITPPGRTRLQTGPFPVPTAPEWPASGRGTLREPYVTREERPDVQPRPRWLPPTRWIIVGALAIVALAGAIAAKAQVNEVPGSPGPVTQVPGTPGPGSRAQLVLRSDGLVLSFDGKVKLEITEDGTIEFSDSATIDLSPTMITSNSGYFYAWAWIKVGGQYRLIPTFSPPDAGGTQRPLPGAQQ